MSGPLTAAARKGERDWADRLANKIPQVAGGLFRQSGTGNQRRLSPKGLWTANNWGILVALSFFICTFVSQNSRWTTRRLHPGGVRGKSGQQRATCFLMGSHP